MKSKIPSREEEPQKQEHGEWTGTASAIGMGQAYSSIYPPCDLDLAKELHPDITLSSKYIINSACGVFFFFFELYSSN